MIKVSVCVMTYNQEKYIGQCLESLVTQETDFDFEIIVGDDFSTDGTRDVIQEYQKKYPDIIKPVFRDKNVGITENIKEIYFVANGEYIAHMDGDDYALPGKLQIQADFLDNNPKCSGVFHRMNILLLDGSIKLDNYKYFGEDGSFDLSITLQRQAVGANSSKMFRKKILDDIIFPKGIELFDWYFHAITAEHGYLAYCDIDKPYGVYRQNVGITYKMPKKFLNDKYYLFVYMLENYDEHKKDICVAIFHHLLICLKSNNIYYAFRFFNLLIKCKSIPFIAYYLSYRRKFQGKK
ncbi:glycosyltransferase family 2 protein [Francisella hispaniensis]|uniref:glycosyltransferase family 2 protein n=1 Tax=Francisella hispaniensis TaxID=622488 RepID=UPI0019076799|nr:glycosyltransferase [Francisella hispaniensis]MBK2356961.1 glycosyltransferase [Francisella hispaniensis]